MNCACIGIYRAERLDESYIGLRGFIEVFNKNELFPEGESITLFHLFLFKDAEATLKINLTCIVAISYICNSHGPRKFFPNIYSVRQLHFIYLV